ncbi:helix-turn-helix domain-containing protein [Marinobacterium aestuariivivens]|uniref:Helix-turn-helix domain-containing protein n=1 Tax=Marinobacterium aestuariivivens TaxID=1698799 RepID=A0ABW2A1D1_9GAMM
MAQTEAIIATLKRTLRASGLTYADVARGLGMSEANVKRLFASERFSLARIEQICQLMQMDLSELFQRYESSRSRITRLSEEQERELVADPLLLMIAVFVQNHLGYDDIIGRYNISERDCIRCLAKLDRLHVIDLLPNNRIKLRIDERFSWIPGADRTLFRARGPAAVSARGLSPQRRYPAVLHRHAQRAFAPADRPPAGGAGP